MDKIVEEKIYDNIDDFIKNISYKGELYNKFTNLAEYPFNGFRENDENVSDEKYAFRGESSDKYDLIPNALRLDKNDILLKLRIYDSKPITEESIQIKAEYDILRNFFNISDYNGLPIPNVNRLRSDMLIEEGVSTFWHKGKWIPDDFFELAGLAQHYGLPTRLLDWSQDIYVALYFAVSDALKDNEEADYIVLWALNIEFIDRCKGLEKPLKIIIPQYNNNPNLCAQKGLFTLWQIDLPSQTDGCAVDRTPLDELIKNTFNGDKTLLYKIKIRITPSTIKNFYLYLKNQGYDASKLFPGYYGITRSIKENAFARVSIKEYAKGKYL